MDRDGPASISSLGIAITTPEIASADEDIWTSDHEHNTSQSPARHTAQEDVLSDLPTIKRQHMTDGYREGLSVGKAKVMQNGFDAGYPVGGSIALRAGKIIGCIEGIMAVKTLADAQRTLATKQYEQAKQELAITALLKDIDDQTLMQSEKIPDRIERTLQKWEAVVFGKQSPLHRESESSN